MERGVRGASGRLAACHGLGMGDYMPHAYTYSMTPASTGPDVAKWPVRETRGLI